MRNQLLIFAFLLMILLTMIGCEGPKGEMGPAGPSGEVTNATCLSSECHGDATLKKTIVNDQEVEEFVPLFVDETQFAATVHGDQKCVSCHNDINASGNAHSDVYKVYGGWARFGRQQATESISINEIERTRNYYTAASTSCITCHSDKSTFFNSAHSTIYKHREANLGDIGGHTVGEDYVAGDCNRCHSSCATCHFKSTISRLDPSGTPMDFWDENQANYPAAGYNDKMSEFEMDWTTNVISHEFRGADYFDDDTENVCEACHTGYQKPASLAFYWTDETQTVYDSVMATNVKRHPQTYDLAISGDPSYQNGGSNTAHAGMACADCHGGNVGNVHALPGQEYEWFSGGDVQCTDCHSETHSNGSVALHFDGSGTEVACIGCHTFGLARDFDPLSGGHDVFIDPITNEVRPVVYKHGLALAWYSHNWQTLDPGIGYGDVNSDCAKKCHYTGNKVNASEW